MQYFKGLSVAQAGRQRLGSILLFAVLVAPGLSWAQNQDVMFITSGKVGIGTDVPLGDLHVKGGSPNEGAIYFEDPDGSQIWKMRVTAANDRFAIIDQNASTAPFTLHPGAPSRSFTVVGSGYVGLGTSFPATRLEVEDPSTNGPVLTIQNALGTCDYTPQAAGEPLVMCSSDLRLKSNVRPVDTGSVLEDLARIELYEYESVVDGKTLLGPVAQHLRESHPERVRAAEDGLLMAQLPSRAELLAAVQELHKLVVALQSSCSRSPESCAGAECP